MKSGKQSQAWVTFCIKFSPKMARRKRSAPIMQQAKIGVEEPAESQQEVEYVTETLDSSQCEEFLSIFSRFPTTRTKRSVRGFSILSTTFQLNWWRRKKMKLMYLLNTFPKEIQAALSASP